MFAYAEVVDILRPLLVEAVPGRVERFRAVANDSRAAQEGDLFFALRTEERDGHDFVADAVAGGAAGVVVEREAVQVPEGVALIRVRDSWRALGDLAAVWRARFHVRVVGVAGNVGKTTTKELVATVLGARYDVLKSQANFNDEVGLSMTLFQLTPAHQRAVVELAMYRLGEIHRLCEIARPEVGVVTNVGPTHLERLGSMEAIADAKAELVESLPAHGTAILNADDPRVRAMAGRTRARTLFYGLAPDADVRATDIEGRGLEGVAFRLHWQNAALPVRVALLPGRHLAPNALAAAAVALTDGMSLEEVAAALEAARVPLRLQVLRGRSGSTILDDTYNANPASMAAALELLSELPGRPIALLGDMRELGSLVREAHLEVGRRAAQAADVIHTVGDLGRLIADAARAAGHRDVHHWPSKQAATEAVAADLRPGDVVLVKASRALALETVLDVLKE